jgi:hypothetical protein
MAQGAEMQRKAQSTKYKMRREKLIFSDYDLTRNAESKVVLEP